MRLITNEIFEQSSPSAQYNIMNACESALSPMQLQSTIIIKADLSGNIFYETKGSVTNELKPLNICIKELAQVAEFGGSDEN